MAFYPFTAASTKHACLSLQRGSTENGPLFIPHTVFVVEAFKAVTRLLARLPSSQLTAGEQHTTRQAAVHLNGILATL